MFKVGDYIMLNGYVPGIVVKDSTAAGNCYKVKCFLERRINVYSLYLCGSDRLMTNEEIVEFKLIGKLRKD